MNYVQERPVFAGGANMLSEADGDQAVQGRQILPAARTGGDRINIVRPPFGFSGAQSAGSIVQQLISVIQQLLSMLGLGGQSMFGTENSYQNATASSTGDPHLAFNGTDIAGNAERTAFDSMNAHADLLDSNSFAGGYQLSTAVTQPAANGVTYNRQATISTDYGQTQVSLDNSGNAYITQDGREYSIGAGQSYSLGNGEEVTRNADGSLIVVDTNGEGGRITTTLSENGRGVDVRAQSQNVDLGGDLPTRQAVTYPPLQMY